MAQPIRVLELPTSDPRKRGQIHGEALRDSIRLMAQWRMAFMLQDTYFASEKDVLELADTHLPLLKAFDADLYEELIGIADGSGLSPAAIVVLNHYTDMRDLQGKINLSDDPADGGCSVMYHRSQTGSFLGQTWDVHASATPHVVVLHLQDTESFVFSVAGCLGMTGINTYGVGVTINNLSSIDARVGVVWPAIVRQMLKQTSAKAAQGVVLSAQLGSGHHYVVADAHEIYAIETSGLHSKVTTQPHDEFHIHTNHCLDPEMRKTHVVRPGSTTFKRYSELERIVKDTQLDDLTSFYNAFCRVGIQGDSAWPHKVATCGTFVMDLTRLEALSSQGVPTSVAQDHPILLRLSK